MQMKLRSIGNSKGLILPQRVVYKLLGRWESGDELDLTLIGEIGVLAAPEPDELELQGALAYAAVKWQRRRLFQALAQEEAS